MKTRSLSVVAVFLVMLVHLVMAAPGVAECGPDNTEAECLAQWTTRTPVGELVSPSSSNSSLNSSHRMTSMVNHTIRTCQPEQGDCQLTSATHLSVRESDVHLHFVLAK